MTHTSNRIELSARRIINSLQLLEIQAAAGDLEGAELAEFNKKHPRGADGRFGGGGTKAKSKVEEVADAAIDKVSDARLNKGQSAMKVERDRAVAKAEVAKAVDAIYASPEKAKAAFNSIGPNVSGAIDTIGKNFNGKSKEVNDNVHKMMDGIGAGIKSNSTNVADTIGKDIAAASVYLGQMASDAGEGFVEGYNRQVSPKNSNVREIGRQAGKIARDNDLVNKVENQIKKVTQPTASFARGVKTGYELGTDPNNPFLKPRNNSEAVGQKVGETGLNVKRLGNKAKRLGKDAATSIGRAATGLAAFMSPDHLMEVGKNLSKAAKDGVKQTPAKIKSMLDDLAKKAKDSIDKGTTAIKDFGAGAKEGFGEGALHGSVFVDALRKGANKAGANIPEYKMPEHEDDNAAKAAGRNLGRFAGDRPRLTGAAIGVGVTAAFGTAGPLSIPLLVGFGIAEDITHPHSVIKKNVGDAYNAAKSKIDSLRGKSDAAKPMSGKEKQETKDKLDKSTANLAIATIAKDDKKVEQHKNEIAEFVQKLDRELAKPLRTADDALKNLNAKLEPLLEQVGQEMEKSPAARATAIGVGLGSLLVGPGALTLGLPAIGVAKSIDTISNKAKESKVQASALPQLMMASVIGASAKAIAATI